MPKTPKTMEDRVEKLEFQVNSLTKLLGKVVGGLNSELSELVDAIGSPAASKPVLVMVKDSSPAEEKPVPAEPVVAPLKNDDVTSGQYGDPKVFRDPPDWSGKSYENKLFSECPSAYLLELARYYDWAAADDKKKNTLATNGKPRHIYRELDAKRARAWAKKVDARESSPQVDSEKSKSALIDPNDPNYSFDDAE